MPYWAQYLNTYVKVCSKHVIWLGKHVWSWRLLRVRSWDTQQQQQQIIPAKDEFLLIQHVVKNSISGTCVWFTYSAEIKTCCRWQRHQALDYKPATEWTHDRKKQNLNPCITKRCISHTNEPLNTLLDMCTSCTGRFLTCPCVKMKIPNCSKLQGSNINAAS